jgi:Asp-tRNA(Asn)/Glu-tRNA(Gln) amidotransferase A subunit family amidase
MPDTPAREPESDASRPSRRRFLTLLSATGVGGAFAERLWALAEARGPITRETVAHAEQLAGLEFSESERDMVLKGLADLRGDFDKIRALALPNSLAPALRFEPARPAAAKHTHRALYLSPQAMPAVPSDLEELAFLPVTQLAQLVHARRVSALDLTRMYLARLKRYDPLLHCVVSLTEERALEQAKRADRELEAGRYLGPLHGIPWGVKDLFAVAGYPTSWGAEPYKDQVLDRDAAVVRRLDDAGAVLVAKLSLGALAMGDVWHGGKTRNPWNPEEGSSGSSAGPAAAVAAGLVGFALGTETRGSIISPCTRCGTTGLRPTFGRVSRDGAMALSWSMDKVGPIARAVEDCALVFHTIQGPAGSDEPVADVAFNWSPDLNVRRLRVGVLTSAFEAKPDKGQEEGREFDRATLETLRKLGVKLTPIELPDLPTDALSFILTVEAAAAFDELTRSKKDALLTRQDADAWPNTLRRARLIPAVEYVQANRVRTLLMRAMERLFADLDAYVAPTFGNPTLRITNLTGHPAAVVPNGFRRDGTPTSITFTGRLDGEAELLALAKAYQDATGFHLRHPKLPPRAGA